MEAREEGENEERETGGGDNKRERPVYNTYRNKYLIPSPNIAQISEHFNSEDSASGCMHYVVKPLIELT